MKQALDLEELDNSTPNAAFAATLKKFDISPTKLAHKAGVDVSVIHKFCNGKELRTDTFFKLEQALSSDARDYFYALRTGNSSLSGTALAQQIDGVQMGELLIELGRRLNNQSDLLSIHQAS